MKGHECHTKKCLCIRLERPGGVADSGGTDSPTTGEDGFILIAAMAMLVTLLGVVLLCLYPLTYEARQAPRHREALHRFKTAERGLFGRLADQPGGLHSACGGYFSDTGFKMVVAELVDAYIGDRARLVRAMEYWFFRRFTHTSPSTPKATEEGCSDIYRWDQDNGFWVGYRGKRYVVRPLGEEHRRRTYNINSLADDPDPQTYYIRQFSVAPNLPILTDGYRGQLELTGEADSKAFFLSGYYDLLFEEHYGSEDKRHYGHRRYYNPVEKLMVKVRDRRSLRTPLSAVLVYAKQPDVEPVDDVTDRLPRLPPRVVAELPYRTDTMDDITSFTFLWDHERIINAGTNDPQPRTCVGHTFEIGLKKLVILESGVTAFACGITIPPVREYQCKERQSIVGGSAGCSQPYYDEYVVEIDYED